MRCFVEHSPTKHLSVPLDIIGGRAPYALNIQWGDASNKVISRPSNQTFRADHVYIKARNVLNFDSGNRRRWSRRIFDSCVYRQWPAICCRRQPAAPNQTIMERLLILWPLYVIAFTVVTSFWLGERREKHVLEKRHLLLHPT